MCYIHYTQHAILRNHRSNACHESTQLHTQCIQLVLHSVSLMLHNMLHIHDITYTLAQIHNNKTCN